MNSLLLVLGLIAALLLGVTVFYAVRLVRVSRQAQDSATRLQAFMSQQRLIDARMGALGQPAPEGAARAMVEGAAPTDPQTRNSSSEVVTCEGVGLRAVSEEAVFVARDPSGEVQVQVGSKPPLPLKYVLDPRMRQALERVVSQATLSYGYSWSILASEDEEGSLSLRRLT